MSWHQSLDRYLTTPYDDGFSDYCEAVFEEFTDSFFDENETWILDDNEQVIKWIDKLFSNCVEPEKAAAIIERSFKLYRL